MNQLLLLWLLMDDKEPVTFVRCSWSFLHPTPPQGSIQSLLLDKVPEKVIAILDREGLVYRACGFTYLNYLEKNRIQKAIEEHGYEYCEEDYQ